MNQRDMLYEQLEYDVLKAEKNYKAWEESFQYFLSLGDKASLGLRCYYRIETDVAYEVWQYKLKNFNDKFGVSL